MRETEKLVTHVAHKLIMGNTIRRNQEQINLGTPWERLSVHDAFERYAKISPEKAISENKFEEIMSFEIEPNLGKNKPIFLYDYPIQMGALALKKAGDSKLAERFELYISGLELCNAFSELSDPIEQRKRFENELSERKKNGKAPYPMPEKFLKSLENMPDASGCALGIDRLVMLFAGADRIDDVVSFTPEEL
jgi:lysyl-tRNA synthetase class 2